MEQIPRSLVCLLAVSVLQAWTSGCFAIVGGVVGDSIHRYEQIGGERFVREARRGQALRIRVRAARAPQTSRVPTRVRMPKDREAQIKGRYLGHDARVIWLQREDDRRVSISVATVRRIERKTDQTYLGEGVVVGLLLDFAVGLAITASMLDSWNSGGSGSRAVP